MPAHVDIIVGLGNPGTEYANTRHNAGFWFVDEVARKFGGNFKYEKKFQGEVARSTIHGQQVWLLKPDTYMNLSRQSVLALMQFYKIKLANVLVVHDDLDLEVGDVRLKEGGGHGGHHRIRRPRPCRRRPCSLGRRRRRSGHRPRCPRVPACRRPMRKRKRKAAMLPSTFSPLLHSLHLSPFWPSRR